MEFLLRIPPSMIGSCFRVNTEGSTHAKKSRVVVFLALIWKLLAIYGDIFRVIPYIAVSIKLQAIV